MSRKRTLVGTLKSAPYDASNMSSGRVAILGFRVIKMGGLPKGYAFVADGSGVIALVPLDHITVDTDDMKSIFTEHQLTT